MLASRHTPALSRSLPSPARTALRAVASVVGWLERQKTRRALARLDVHSLRDVGLSPEARDSECAKPFWRD